MPAVRRTTSSASEDISAATEAALAPTAPAARSAIRAVAEPVVCSYTEWDPLEEVVVGVVDGASVPPWHVALRATMPEESWAFFQERGGQPFPQEQIDAAARELDGFARRLEREGIAVRRPDVLDHRRPYSTPDWSSAGGLYAAMPRDVLLVVGEDLIEVPMAWRSRYFEIAAYRRLLTEYFRAGARWTAAPKPLLRDELYDQDYDDPVGDEPRSVLREIEPTFDAADFIRCGQDLFYQLSNVTNQLGVDWLARHLGEGFQLHPVPVRDSHPMHIDASFMPLAPGKLLINPERVPTIPPMFRDWEVRRAPPPDLPASHTLYMSSRWLSMNVLMLDERRVMVERQERALSDALAGWGFEPIPCDFRAVQTFGGSFHCVTLDVRRRGGLRSYF